MSISAASNSNPALNSLAGFGSSAATSAAAVRGAGLLDALF